MEVNQSEMLLNLPEFFRHHQPGSTHVGPSGVRLCTESDFIDELHIDVRDGVLPVGEEGCGEALLRDDGDERRRHRFHCNRPQDTNSEAGGSQPAIRWEPALTEPASVLLQVLRLGRSQDVPGLHPDVQSHVVGVHLQWHRAPRNTGAHVVGGTPAEGTFQHW